MASEELWFVPRYVVCVGVSIAGLALLNLATPELLFLSAFVGLLAAAEYSEPELSGTKLSKLVWLVTLVGFGVFAYTAFLWVQQIIASTPTAPA
jgi:hypothetical protein